jgi:hypothetical protein
LSEKDHGLKIKSDLQQSLAASRLLNISWNGTWSLIVLFDGIAVAAIVMNMEVTIMNSPKRLKEIMQRCKA